MMKNHSRTMKNHSNDSSQELKKKLFYSNHSSSDTETAFHHRGKVEIDWLGCNKSEDDGPLEKKKNLLGSFQRLGTWFFSKCVR
jgi:hypothetical protein